MTSHVCLTGWLIFLITVTREVTVLLKKVLSITDLVYNYIVKMHINRLLF